MLTPTDTTTLTAAASALRHTPAHMRTAHLADRLEEMAGRVREAQIEGNQRNGGSDENGMGD